MKFLFFIFLGSQLTIGQNLYQSDNASINFDAGKALVEPIKAVNNKARVVFDVDTGEIACLIQVQDFDFPNKLMQEHFNENYLESNLYPKATFVGKIENFESSNSAFSKTLFVNGVFKIHGVHHKKIIKVNLVYKGGVYYINSDFLLELEEFKIKIPKLMFYKIAEEVSVNFRAKLNNK